MATATMERTALMHPQLVADVHQQIGAAGICRTDKEIDNAIQGAVERHADTTGRFVEASSIATNAQAWDELMHARLGILDRLGIDSEDTLYDRWDAPEPRPFKKWEGMGW